jgi:uncharacterized protein YndB with AHSA1/START domain
VGLPPPRDHWVVISLGVLATMVLYVAGVCLQKSYAASFFVAPTFVGALVGLLSLRHPFRNTWLTLGLSLLLGVVTLQEGVVCVLFSVPLIAPLTMLGTACGWTVRRHVRARRHQNFLGALLVLVSLGWQAIEGRLDDPARHPVQVAATALEIPAPPERVWAALTEHPLEVAPRWQWFLRLGLPMPRRMALAEAGPQGKLRLDFSQGTAHGHVTTWAPARALSLTVDRYDIQDLPFHITRLGRGPHWGLKTERVEDWLTLLELRYTLEPTPTGGTRLHRQTTWRRHLAPGFYFGWLQQQIISRGQTRLIELVRERVEEAEGALPGTPVATVSSSFSPTTGCLRTPARPWPMRTR